MYCDDQLDCWASPSVQNAGKEEEREGFIFSVDLKELQGRVQSVTSEGQTVSK